jgi:anti-sigma regulatory factor (Ser/Thr protein kinase)
MFPARLGAVRAVREFLESFCRDAGIARSPGLRLNLVVEELFTNTVTHGHGGDCESPVWIALEAKGATVTLTYLDRAPPFNPFGIAPRPILDGSLEQRKEGGLGVLLATELTAAAEYAHLFGRNRLRMVLVH